MNLMNFVEWSDAMKVLERSSQSIWGETIKQTVRTEQEINKPLKENMEQFFRKKEQATQQAKKIYVTLISAWLEELDDGSYKN